MSKSLKISILEIKEAPFLEKYLNKNFIRMEFFINGQRLYPKLKKANDYGENKFGSIAPPQKYRNIEFYYAMLDMFLGKEPKDIEGCYALELFKNNRIGLYECGDCGYLECGILTAELMIDADTVTWCNFAYQNDYYENFIDYKDFQFVFNRQNYEKAFNDLYNLEN